MAFTIDEARRMFDLPPWAPTREALLFRFFAGYGLVVASTVGGSLHFIYMAGDPPQSVRDACEREKEDLVALLARESVPPVRGVARSVEQRAWRACYRGAKRLHDFLLKRTHEPDATRDHETGG